MNDPVLGRLDGKVPQCLIDRMYRPADLLCTPEEWYSAIIELDEKLSKLHPDYAIRQIKQKFGGLRFYASGVDDEGVGLIIDCQQECRL